MGVVFGPLAANDVAGAVVPFVAFEVYRTPVVPDMGVLAGPRDDVRVGDVRHRALFELDDDGGLVVEHLPVVVEVDVGVDVGRGESDRPEDGVDDVRVDVQEVTAVAQFGVRPPVVFLLAVGLLVVSRLTGGKVRDAVTVDPLVTDAPVDRIEALLVADHRDLIARLSAGREFVDLLGVGRE